MGAGRDNNVPFIRQNGPVQKLQYPDNPRDARSQSKRGRIEKTAAGMKVPVDTRVLPCEGARMCGRNRGVVSGRVSKCRGQSTDFGADIAEFQWTHWPRKPIAVHLPISLLSFFYPHVLKSWKVGIFSPNTTRCCGLKRPSTKRVRHFDNGTYRNQALIYKHDYFKVNSLNAQNKKHNARKPMDIKTHR